MEAATSYSHRKDKVSDRVPLAPTGGKDALWSPLSLRTVLICLLPLVLSRDRSGAMPHLPHMEGETKQWI